MNNNIIKIKFVIIAIIVFVIGIIAYFTYQTVYRSDKVQVNVTTIPSDAKITINKQVISNGETYISPGDYTITVEKAGFTTSSEKANFAKPSGIVDVALTPESTEAQIWAEQHATEYSEFEGRAGTRAVDSGEKFTAANPIIKNLPFKNFLFTIGYFIDPADTSSNTIIVTVNAPEGYRQAAINKIEEWGFNPADHNIIFKVYENPFSL